MRNEKELLGLTALYMGILAAKIPFAFWTLSDIEIVSLLEETYEFSTKEKLVQLARNQIVVYQESSEIEEDFIAGF